MHFISVCPATNDSFDGIAKSSVPAELSAPIEPVHTTSSRRANPLPPSCRNNESKISNRCHGVAAMEPPFKGNKMHAKIPYLLIFEQPGHARIGST